jgi:hypothetical protein
MVWGKTLTIVWVSDPHVRIKTTRKEN